MEDQTEYVAKNQKIKTHPKANANFFSHYFFCWQIPVILNSRNKNLTEDDFLYKPLDEYNSKELGDQLETLWTFQEKFTPNPSLARCLMELFLRKYLLLGLLFLLPDLLVSMTRPYCLQKLLDYYTPNQNELSKHNALLYAFGLIATSILRVLVAHYFFFECTVVGMKARIACSSLIYRRLLKMKTNDFDIGKVINLLSNDLTKFEQIGQTLHFIWIGLVQFIAIICYADVLIGHAAMTGGAVIIIALLIQSINLTKRRRKVVESTDYRIKLMNDLIRGIQSIKLYTWERLFDNLVKSARRSEMEQIHRFNCIKFINGAVRLYMSKLCVFVSVIVAVQQEIPLTSQFGFVLATIYETLKIAVMIFTPLAIIYLAEAIVSIRRIEGFLLIGKRYLTGNYIVKKNRRTGVKLSGITARWNPSSRIDNLKNINFEANPGDFIGIIGAAGSGKSTLLQTILNEVKIVSGRSEIDGVISYASQTPWIFDSTIRQNILFGEHFNLDRYETVIRICALDQDLVSLPDGDQTIVGERGVLLSGGQKSRINLARAVYKISDIYLLDDPLSAVDSHVAQHIVRECIGEFLQTKCVILVTHQVHFLQDVTKIYQLIGGKIIKVDNYEEVIGQGEMKEDKKLSEYLSTVNLKTRNEFKEHRGEKIDNLDIYKKYSLSAGHWMFPVLILILFAIAQISICSLDIFLAQWINKNTDNDDFLSIKNAQIVYTSLMLFTMLILHLAIYIFTHYCTRASLHLHNRMLSTVLVLAMKFFNHHSSGRILNRFTKDMGVIDEHLPMHFLNLLCTIFGGSSIIIIIISINIWLIFPSLVMLSIIAAFVLIFQPANRNIKRTEGSTKSVVFTQITESIKGLPTIRAHNCESHLIQEFDNHQNIHSSTLYINLASFASFGFWTDMLASIYSGIVTLSFICFDTGVHVGNIGFAITLSIGLLGIVQFGFKTFTDLDTQMTAVERVIEYADLESECDDEKTVPPESWPAFGNVDFDTVTLKYNPDESSIVKNVSFSIKGGEKVGIVGRTGAGKSSLTNILFRLFDFEGTVKIDGVDIKSMPLRSLRSKMSIIPQEPILFLGTLRKNIDPFGQFTDGELWKTLEDLQMKEMISLLPQGLKSDVRENGGNFSVGQRQLLCLARAILRNCKIVVLDEATANVDLKTDALIQTIIREKLRSCTVITIAHRLNTVIDSDKILMMDGGRVVEFDSPDNLLQNTESHFYQLLQKNGKQVFDNLKIHAKNTTSKEQSSIF